MPKRPESIFTGSTNAALRARIREITDDATSCAGAISARIERLRNVVALTAVGRSKLDRVAAEYLRRGPSHRFTCDCDYCYHINCYVARPAGF